MPQTAIENQSETKAEPAKLRTIGFLDEFYGPIRKGQKTLTLRTLERQDLTFQEAKKAMATGQIPPRIGVVNERLKVVLNDIIEYETQVIIQINARYLVTAGDITRSSFDRLGLVQLANKLERHSEDLDSSTSPHGRRYANAAQRLIAAVAAVQNGHDGHILTALQAAYDVCHADDADNPGINYSTLMEAISFEVVS